MRASDVDKMTDEAVRDYLKSLIIALDSADEDDCLGTEGWRHFLMNED